VVPSGFAARTATQPRSRANNPPPSNIANAQGSAAAPAYVERHGEPADLDELVRHRCLIYSLSALPRDWTLRDAASAERTVSVEG
jgi:hypothetical protein